MIRLTRAQVREIDRLATERYLIPSIALMENAARSAAEVASDMLGGECFGQVLILCGGGNNGGDGLAVARHLHNRGADVSIALTTRAEDYKGDALINFNIVREMQLKIAPVAIDDIPKSSALLIIDAVKHSRKPVLAIDVPSGLDCDTGEPLGPCIEATQTITFVAEKVGFENPKARKYLGNVVIGDIGCPRELVVAATPASPRA
jgi:NAD(P)H-hydrate epimerase